MGLNKKQKEQVKEAIDFVESNDVLSLYKDPNRIKSDNPYIEHIFSVLNVYDISGFTDKEGFVKWSLDNMRYSISPLNSQNFQSPDPY